MPQRIGVACISCGLVLVSLLTFVNFVNQEALAANWTIEVVDSMGYVGTYTSIALNSSNYPHISYWDNDEISLKLASWNGISWTIETVDSSGYAGLYTSLAIDSNDIPHISYIDIYYYDLKYARKTGSTWDIEVVDSSHNINYQTSIALDSNDYPHISYCDFYNGDLKHAWWNGTSWNTENIDAPPARVGEYSSIAIDRFDFLHVSYHDSTFSDLRYAKWNGIAWTSSIVDHSGSVGYYSSIALDSNDYPHISYFRSNATLYAKWNGSAWKIEPLDPTNTWGDSTSIVIDSSDYPQVCYYNGRNRNLGYARHDGNSWIQETIDSKQYVGRYCSIALDSGDNPHVSYYDYLGSDLRYARGVSTNPPSTPTITGSSSGFVGITYNYTVIATDPDGDKIKYVIDWGDANTSESGFVNSGTSVNLSHSWSSSGTYYIKAKAVDIHLVSSPWSIPLTVKIRTSPEIPGEPRNLYASAGLGQINLTWLVPLDDGGSSIINYTIYRGTSPGGEVYHDEIGNYLNYSDSGLANGQKFYYRITAKNVIGEGPMSNEAGATTYNTPDAPRSLSAVTGNQQIILYWSPPLNSGGLSITNYTIYRGTTSGGEVFLSEIGYIHNYIDVGLVNGQIYYYQVAAKNSLGEGPKSNEASGIPATTPSAPENLSASSGDREIWLNWSPPLNNGGLSITNYRIYRGTSPGYLPYYTEIGNVTTFHNLNLINGITYYYRVQARNMKGLGNQSNMASATPMTGPREPHSLLATATPGKIILTWQPPSNNGGSPITNYSIYRGNFSGGEQFLIKIGNIVTYEDSGLSSGKTYYYQVSAWNVIGESPKSLEVSATTPDIPSSPENLVALPTKDQITLLWTAPLTNGGSAITNYRIYRGTTPGGETLLTEIGDILQFTDTGLPSNQIYYYQVSAVNAVGEGPRSIEVNATTPTIPEAPIGLVAVAGESEINITWLPPPSNGGLPITNYRIYRGLTPNSESFLTEIGSFLSFTDSGLTNGQIYYYKVSAKNAFGESPYSNEANAIPATIPSYPLNLTSVAGNGKVTLTWSPPVSNGGRPIINYTIYRGIISGGEQFLTKIGNIHTYSDIGLVNGLTYYYKVAAVTIIGEGLLSFESSATPATIPTEPLNVQTIAGDSKIELFWTCPLSNGGYPIIHYRIYRGTLSGGEILLVEIDSVSSYIDSGLINGQNYFYRISAKTIIGEGPMSDEVSNKPGTTPGPPLDVRTEIDSGIVTLTWSEPIDDGGYAITNYLVYRGQAPGGEVLLITLGNVLTFEDTGLTNGQIYYYQIKAKNVFGVGLNSIEVSAIPATIPSTPLDLQATPGVNQITLTWCPPATDGGSPITNYRLYRGSASGEEVLLAILGNDLTYADTGLKTNQFYYYKVSAVNELGEGPISYEVSATPILDNEEVVEVAGSLLLLILGLMAILFAIVFFLIAYIYRLTKTKHEKVEKIEENTRIDEEHLQEQEVQLGNNEKID